MLRVPVVHDAVSRSTLLQRRASRCIHSIPKHIRGSHGIHVLPPLRNHIRMLQFLIPSALHRAFQHEDHRVLDSRHGQYQRRVQLSVDFREVRFPGNGSGRSSLGFRIRGNIRLPDLHLLHLIKITDQAIRTILLPQTGRLVDAHRVKNSISDHVTKAVVFRHVVHFFYAYRTHGRTPDCHHDRGPQCLHAHLDTRVRIRSYCQHAHQPPDRGTTTTRNHVDPFPDHEAGRVQRTSSLTRVLHFPASSTIHIFQQQRIDRCRHAFSLRGWIISHRLLFRANLLRGDFRNG